MTSTATAPHFRRTLSSDDGFTLVELLVVILIVGILAAIALPNFLTQRDKAYDVRAISAARSYVDQMETCAIEQTNIGNCNNDTVGTTATGFSQGTGDNQVTVTVVYDIVGSNGSGGAWTVWATSKSGNKFGITHTVWGEWLKRCWAKPGVPDGEAFGGCPASRVWG